MHVRSEERAPLLRGATTLPQQEMVEKGRTLPWRPKPPAPRPQPPRGGLRSPPTCPSPFPSTPPSVVEATQFLTPRRKYRRSRGVEGEERCMQVLPARGDRGDRQGLVFLCFLFHGLSSALPLSLLLVSDTFRQVRWRIMPTQNQHHPIESQDLNAAFQNLFVLVCFKVRYWRSKN